MVYQLFLWPLMAIFQFANCKRWPDGFLGELNHDPNGDWTPFNEGTPKSSLKLTHWRNLWVKTMALWLWNIIAVWLVVSKCFKHGFYVPLHKKGMSSFPLTNSYFSRWLKLPTSHVSNCFPGGYMLRDSSGHDFTYSPVADVWFSPWKVNHLGDL